MTKKVRLQIGALAILSSLVYIGLEGAHNFSSYFVTVNAYRAHMGQFADKTFRVQGTLLASSVRYNEATTTLSFTLQAKGQSLPVVYRGAMPNEQFKNADAIVEGKIGSNGVFQASKLMIQCPNHYVAAKSVGG